jgi:mono/diheme cytochrome c family protein
MDALRRSGLAVVVAGALAALGSAGCGGVDQTAGSIANESAGKAFFQESCGGCHTLKAAGTEGTVGPNLDSVKPSVERVQTAIRLGPGPMPERILQGKREQQVAEFVADNAGR